MRSIVFILLALSSLAIAQEPAVDAPRLLQAQELSIPVDAEVLQRQFDALKAMQLETVEYSRLGSVKRIVGDTGVVLPPDARNLKAGDSGDDVLQAFKDVLLSNSTETLRVTRHDSVGLHPKPTIRALRLSQEVRGIPVVNSFIGLEYDDLTRQVSKFVAVFIPDRGLEHEPKVTAVRAEQVVPAALAGQRDSADAQVEILEGTKLAYFHKPSDPTPPKLVWVVQAQVGNGFRWAYYADAMTGDLVDRLPLTSTITRKVYDANGAPWSIPNQVPSTSMTLSQWTSHGT